MKKQKVLDAKTYYKAEIKKALKEVKTKGKRKGQIPNILSATRLLAPFCIIPAVFLGNIPVAVIFIIFFAITDIADGLIARKFNLTTEFGMDLDAASDKVFISTLLIAASFMKIIVLINLLLELLIAVINLALKMGLQNPITSRLGKVKMWFLCAMIVCAFLVNLEFMHTLFYIFFAISFIFQIIVVSNYLHNYKAKKRKYSS